jgi:putative transposase
MLSAIAYHRWFIELHQHNKPYHTDHGIVYRCQYHVFFCLKYRRKVLTYALVARMKELGNRSGQG